MAGRGRGRFAGAAALALAGLALTAPAASADVGFHFLKIREVFVGAGNPGAAFVELQAYANGQENIDGHTITFYDELAAPLGTFPITTDPPSGDSQRSVLIGGPGVSPAPDYTYDIGAVASGYGTGGALCFDNLDCVAWGSFAAPASLPSPPGANAPAMPAGMSLERSIAAGCATLLEELDDTNVSASDFFVSTPSPRNNTATPTEQSCLAPGEGPETRIDEGPKKRTKKKKATFEFSSTAVGATFQCSVDGKAFAECASPHSLKVKKGKHQFRVRAVLNGIPDASPAEQRWKVKKRKRK